MPASFIAWPIFNAETQRTQRNAEQFNRGGWLSVERRRQALVHENWCL